MGISRIRRVMNSGLDVDIRTQANEHPHVDTIFKPWKYDNDQAGGRKKGRKKKRKNSTAQHSTPTATVWR